MRHSFIATEDSCQRLQRLLPFYSDFLTCQHSFRWVKKQFSDACFSGVSDIVRLLTLLQDYVNADNCNYGWMHSNHLRNNYKSELINNRLSKNGSTGLYYACWHGNMDIVRILVVWCLLTFRNFKIFDTKWSQCEPKRFVWSTLSLIIERRCIFL